MQLSLAIAALAPTSALANQEFLSVLTAEPKFMRKSFTTVTIGTFNSTVEVMFGLGFETMSRETGPEASWESARHFIGVLLVPATVTGRSYPITTEHIPLVTGRVNGSGPFPAELSGSDSLPWAAQGLPVFHNATFQYQIGTPPHETFVNFTGVEYDPNGTTNLPSPFMSQNGSGLFPNTNSTYIPSRNDFSINAQEGDRIVVYTRSNFEDTVTTTAYSDHRVGRFSTITVYQVNSQSLTSSSIDSRILFGQPNFDGEVPDDPNASSRNVNFRNWYFRGGLFAGQVDENSTPKPKDESGSAMVMLSTPGGGILRTITLNYLGMAARWAPTQGSLNYSILARSDFSPNMRPAPTFDEWRWTEPEREELNGLDPRPETPGWLCGPNDLPFLNGGLPTQGAPPLVSYLGNFNLQPQALTAAPIPLSINLKNEQLLFVRPSSFLDPSWAYFAGPTYEERLAAAAPSTNPYVITGLHPMLHSTVLNSEVETTFNATFGLGADPGNQSSLAPIFPTPFFAFKRTYN